MNESTYKDAGDEIVKAWSDFSGILKHGKLLLISCGMAL